MSRAVLMRKSEAAPAAKAAAPPKVLTGGLHIGEPDDAFEREADRVADTIMAGGRTKADWSLSRMGIDAKLRRKCACGASAGSGGECEDCKEKKSLQRKPAGQAQYDGSTHIVHDVLNSPGTPLDEASRKFFEPRFGHDFSKVRIHTDATASESAKSVNARAYTVGDHIVFDRGSHAPQHHDGRKLLAHELTHVVQQSGTVGLPPVNVAAAPVDIAAERDAQWNSNNIRVANAVPLSTLRTGAEAANGRLQRQPAPASPCKVEVCFIPIKAHHLGAGGLGFSHGVINVEDSAGKRHIEVDPSVHGPTGMLHSHVLKNTDWRESDECTSLTASCADIKKIEGAAETYENRDVIYDPLTQVGPNSNSFVEWTLDKAGFTTSTVNVPTLASGWSFFTKNPAERIDPPHVARAKPTAAGASTKSSAGAACKKVFKPATGTADFIVLVREAETRMTAAGIATTSDQIKTLRGLYYGTPWSVDFAEEKSASRIAGFQLFTASGVKLPRDPVSILDCGLYQALQLSQDMPGPSGKVDIGHLMIALDARNATVASVSTPNLPFLGFGGSGVEIVTWLGDLGGGAASLALDRAHSATAPISKKFTGNDYGAPSNLEGDVAGFLVARGGAKGSDANAPVIPAGKGVADALEDYFAPSKPTGSTEWQQRARTFLELNGGNFDASGTLTNEADIIKKLADKIESFACNYLAQRKADSSKPISDTDFLNAADNVEPCSKEMAQTFVNVLEDTAKSSAVGLKATSAHFPAPLPASTNGCLMMTGNLRAKLKLRQWGIPGID